jgi:hypothetical protein
MLQVWLVAAALLAQDPKAAPRTVEERLKELDEKLSVLEKKQKSLHDENAAMELEVARRKLARQNAAEQTAGQWVQRYAPALDLEERQKTALIDLWRKWTLDDFDKPADAAVWKEREETLRKELRPAQIPLLARKVKEGHEADIRRSVSFFGQAAKLSPEKRASFEKIVMGKLSFEEGPLLLQAHSERLIPWTRIVDAIESSLPELSGALTETEQTSLRKLLDQWKPRQR